MVPSVVPGMALAVGSRLVGAEKSPWPRRASSSAATNVLLPTLAAPRTYTSLPARARISPDTAPPMPSPVRPLTRWAEDSVRRLRSTSPSTQACTARRSAPAGRRSALVPTSTMGLPPTTSLSLLRKEPLKSRRSTTSTTSARRSRRARSWPRSSSGVTSPSAAPAPPWCATAFTISPWRRAWHREHCSRSSWRKRSRVSYREGSTKPGSSGRSVCTARPHP
mmetsp:Transcript_23887/g.81460  ORF Transcript_23887/g.81460 Transcript_23887/m.81460 type:complete len:222 (-) Transcript_23887:88-753(-)